MVSGHIHSTLSEYAVSCVIRCSYISMGDWKSHFVHFRWILLICGIGTSQHRSDSRLVSCERAGSEKIDEVLIAAVRVMAGISRLGDTKAPSTTDLRRRTFKSSLCTFDGIDSLGITSLKPNYDRTSIITIIILLKPPPNAWKTTHVCHWQALFCWHRWKFYLLFILTGPWYMVIIYTFQEIFNEAVV